MASPRFTIDELAAETGVGSSTIRYYQQEGLVSSPDHVGRRAYYDRGHVRQIEEVVALSRRGFSLTAIAELRAAEAGGRTLTEVLRSPELDRTQQMVEMTWEELAAQVLGTSTDEDAPIDVADLDLEQLFAVPRRLGIVVPTPGGTVLVHLAALRLGDELRALGIPREVLLEGHLALRELMDRAASLLLDQYRQRVSTSGAATDDDQFVRLARAVVDLTFLRALDAAVDDSGTRSTSEGDRREDEPGREAQDDTGPVGS